MIENVFLIATQTQYLNAIEAAAAFGVDYEASLLIGPRAMVRKRGLPAESWAQTEWYSYSEDVGRLTRALGRSTRAARAMRTLDHVRTLRSLVPRDLRGVRVFVGNVQDRRARALINHLDPSEVVLLDDGTATIDIARTLQEGTAEGTAARLIGAMTGLDFDYPDAGTLFTTYEVDLPSGWTRRANDYAVLRASFGATPVREETLLIGGPYVDLGWMILDDYVARLQQMRAFAQYPLTYVPHRGEQSDVVDTVAERVGCTVWRPPDALETALVEQERVPAGVLGFYSSFLPNAAAIFGERCAVTAVEVPFPLAPDRVRATITRVYTYFRTHVPAPNFSVRLLPEGVLAP